MKGRLFSGARFPKNVPDYSFYEGVNRQARAFAEKRKVRTRVNRAGYRTVIIFMEREGQEAKGICRSLGIDPFFQPVPDPELANPDSQKPPPPPIWEKLSVKLETIYEELCRTVKSNTASAKLERAIAERFRGYSISTGTKACIISSRQAMADHLVAKPTGTDSFDINLRVDGISLEELLLLVGQFHAYWQSPLSSSPDEEGDTHDAP